MLRPELLVGPYLFVWILRRRLTIANTTAAPEANRHNQSPKPILTYGRNSELEDSDKRSEILLLVLRATRKEKALSIVGSHNCFRRKETPGPSAFLRKSKRVAIPLRTSINCPSPSIPLMDTSPNKGRVAVTHGRKQPTTVKSEATIKPVTFSKGADCGGAGISSIDISLVCHM